MKIRFEAFDSRTRSPPASCGGGWLAGVLLQRRVRQVLQELARKSPYLTAGHIRDVTEVCIMIQIGEGSFEGAHWPKGSPFPDSVPLEGPRFPDPD